MKIFISHSSHDKWVARQISERLVALGHETFLDEKDLRTGESIDSKIQKHLKTSDDVLLLISPQSLKSQWVFIELGAAQALGKNIIPIFFHVAANQIPHAISLRLGRDINEIERYFEELQSRAASVSHGRKPRLTKRPKLTPRTTLKVGDKVTVVNFSLLTEADRYQEPFWVSEMNKYSGRTGRISGFDELGWPELDIDVEKHAWHPTWLIES
ncbi:MAG TPA: toll/interleukin-1 receptor domain-containing protein [Pyrinomonadaceae bacterium]|jgi:hypothetical protein|nr:toll/interleukin-1 receptor domain-containing protein [Pyrinomonadaceae bacterium]